MCVGSRGSRGKRLCVLCISTRKFCLKVIFFETRNQIRFQLSAEVSSGVGNFEIKKNRNIFSAKTRINYVNNFMLKSEASIEADSLKSNEII